MKPSSNPNFTRARPPGISRAVQKPVHPMPFWPIAFVLCLALLLVSGLASAAALSNVQGGQLFFKNDSGLTETPTLEAYAKIDVSGMVARVTLTQAFQNNTDTWQEAVYAFPLVSDAAVDGMTIRVDQRIIEGEIQEKRQAKKIYQQAKAQGKTAALVKQNRPNLFTTSVANVAPQQRVEIEIRYQQTVAFDNGSFSLRFPMTVTPRYIPDGHLSQEVGVPEYEHVSLLMEDAGSISSPIMSDDVMRLNLIDIEVTIDAGVALETIASANHPVVTTDTGAGYRVRLQDNMVPMDRDFELSWQPHVGGSPKATLFTEQIAGETFAMFMVYPPNTPVAKSYLPREMILVIDSSGSMGGVSMIQAKAALNLALQKLHSSDSFNIVDFDSDARRLFRQSMPVNQNTLDEARRFISGLNADGGTEMHRALALALTDPPNDGLLRQVVFVTDGSVGNEDALFKYIQSHLGDTRLFTVGIGSAPNTYFMRSAARFGRGTYTYVNSQDQVTAKMEQLFEKLETPALTDIELDFEGAIASEIWPNRIPDLYKGEPMVVAAKLSSPRTKVTLRGSIAKTAWQQQVYSYNSVSHGGIAKLWARNKIEALMDQKILGKSTDQIRAEVLPLALEHGLVTPFTSFVAVDKTPSNANPDQLASHKIPNHMPAGSQFPSTATLWPLKMLFGFILTLWALIVLSIRRLRLQREN